MNGTEKVKSHVRGWKNATLMDNEFGSIEFDYDEALRQKTLAQSSGYRARIVRLGRGYGVEMKESNR